MKLSLEKYPMFKNLSFDIARYSKNKKMSFKEMVYLFFEQGIWCIAIYRFGRWAHDLKIPVVRLVLKIIAFFLFKLSEVLCGISIPASARIGKGFYVGHFGGIIVHSDAQLGENCSIGPGVVIGTRGLGGTGVPQIGNNVYIGVGAKVLGNIKIGNDVRIGANAVVINDVPDNATVVGIPARMIGKK